MPKYIIATVAEIPPGTRKIIEISGRSVGVFNIAGEFFALRNNCPHQSGPLCQGTLSGLVESSKPGDYQYSRPNEILRCPWHGWEFDIRTGQSWCDPSQTRVRRYEVQVEAGPQPELLEIDPATDRVKGPHIAETYPVSVEQQVVIVEIM